MVFAIFALPKIRPLPLLSMLIYAQHINRITKLYWNPYPIQYVSRLTYECFFSTLHISFEIWKHNFGSILCYLNIIILSKCKVDMPGIWGAPYTNSSFPPGGCPSSLCCSMGAFHFNWGRFLPPPQTVGTVYALYEYHRYINSWSASRKHILCSECMISVRRELDLCPLFSVK